VAIDITEVVDRKRAAMAVFGGTQAKPGEDYERMLDGFFASVKEERALPLQPVMVTDEDATDADRVLEREPRNERAGAVHLGGVGRNRIQHDQDIHVRLAAVLSPRMGTVEIYSVQLGTVQRPQADFQLSKQTMNFRVHNVSHYTTDTMYLSIFIGRLLKKPLTRYPCSPLAERAGRGEQEATQVIGAHWRIHEMRISTAEAEVPVAENVTVTEDTLSVDLSDGRTISVPLAWFPRLLHGTKKERNNWRLIGKGYGIHWEDLDEDISVENLIFGQASGKVSRPLKNGCHRDSLA